MASSINRSSNFYHNSHQIQHHQQHQLHKQGNSLTSNPYPQQPPQQSTTLPGINPQQSL